MNIQTLTAKKQEWEEVKNILELGTSANGRWMLLQLWLRRHPEWLSLVETILITDDDSCFAYFQNLLQVSDLELALLDPTQKIRKEVARYIGVVKDLYAARTAA